MSGAIAVENKENTRYLNKILQNIVFLRRQVLALRRDGDDKSGNFYRLMLLRALDDPGLLKWINSSYDRHIPVGYYMFKVNNRNTRTRCEICSELTIKIPERHL